MSSGLWYCPVCELDAEIPLGSLGVPQCPNGCGRMERDPLDELADLPDATDDDEPEGGGSIRA